MSSQNSKPAESPSSTPTVVETIYTPFWKELSPCHWLFIIGLSAGLLVAWYLGNRSVAGPQPDNFKPEVVIIQLNDTYRVDALENGKVGGLGRVATLIKQTQAQNKHVLIVHAGDFIAPSLESKVFNGKQMIEALNHLNKLAQLYVVPGNHEFDDPNPDMVVDAMENSNFEWLGSNVKINPGTASTNKKIFDNRLVTIGRLKLGIFALTLHGDHRGKDQAYAPVAFDDKYLINDVSLEGMGDELPKSALEKVSALKNQSFQTRDDILKALSQATGIQDTESLSSLADYASIGYTRITEEQIGELERAGADVIIGLTHLNMPDDRQLSTLRRSHPKFMWIAGGHEHYAQRELLSADRALITKGDSNARRVWSVAIGFNNGAPDIREEKIDLNESTVKVDADYQHKIADHYHAALVQKFPYLNEIIGTTKSLPADCLEGDEEAVRNAPSNWGIYIAEQMRITNGQGKMQIGLLNGGGIRIDDRPCGDLSFEDLERTFGFKTEIIYAKLRGRDLKQSILENAVAGKRGSGRFLQFAGIRFLFDRHRPPGDRVFAIEVEKGSKWVPFDNNETYSVAVPKFLYECNDGYKFKERIKSLLPPGPDIRTLVYNALYRAKPKIGAEKSKASTSNLKTGAVELPEYAKASVPKLGPWTQPPPNHFCPQ